MNQFAKFVNSFDFGGSEINVLFDHRKILVDNNVTINVYEPVRKYTCIVQALETEHGVVHAIDFYLEEFINRSSLHWAADEYNVTIEYVEESKQLWVYSHDRDNLLEFIIDQRFPARAVPNFDPTKVEKGPE